ncbi:MAG: hypothetical protein ABIL58_22595 [Pseudomonadota bacterium]
MSKPDFPIRGSIAIMVIGLVLLLSSRYTSGHSLYARFVAVKAVCVDRETRDFVDPDSVKSLIKSTFWKPRILCNFEFESRSYQVTPIIFKMVAFNTKEGVDRYLDQRIDKNGNCTLWIDPENPLHAVFHKKPKNGPYTV